jgi:hypothetical protein
MLPEIITRQTNFVGLAVDRVFELASNVVVI